MRTRGRLRTAIVALVALAGVAFLPVGDAGFVAYDDPDYVTGNQAVLEGLRPAGLAWALTSFHAGNWHPLTWASHQLDVTLFGLRPGAHHLMSLALHAASAVLLLLALRGLTGVLWPAFLVAALFAVHPLHVESVAWVAERKDVLAGLFGALTLLAHRRYVARPGPGRAVLTLAVFALGLTAKPTLVTLPLVLLLLDWWPLGRFHAAPPGPTSRRASSAWRPVAEKIPLLALSAASGAATFLAQRSGGAMADAGRFPPEVRAANAAVSAVKYVGRALWPADLVYYYPHPLGTLPGWQIAAGALLLAAATAGAVALHRRRPWLAAGWLWYAALLVPVIGIVQVGRQGMADRYSYLPLTGLFVAAAWEARSRGLPARIAAAAPAGAAVILAAFAALAHRQAGHWRDTQALTGHLLSVDPRNSVAANLKGMDLLSRRDAAAAVPLFRAALEQNPGYHEARYNLALALAQAGETEEAARQYALLVRADPRDAEARYNLGVLLAARGDLRQALEELSAAAALEPGRARIRLQIGRTLEALGRPREALGHVAEAVRLDPASTEARDTLARIREGRLP